MTQMSLLRFLFIPLFFMIVGCGGGARKSDTSPLFEQPTRIVIAPFAADESVGNVGKRVPMMLGTRAVSGA